MPLQSLIQKISRILLRSLSLLLAVILITQLIIGSILFIFPIKEAEADGTTYYVDCNAAAGGDGTTQATSGAHAAWDTIADVNAASFSPGDSILFNKGCTWREQLTVPSSGSSGSPITFGAYGTGADPIISGADLKIASTDWRGYEHSDDFETGDFSKWDQENETDSNTVSVITAAKYAGTYGARATLAQAGGHANVQVDLAALSSDITVEFYIRLSSDFDLTATWGVQSICMFTSTGWNRATVEVMQGNDGEFWIRGENVGPFSQINSSAISLDTWYKVKYRYVVNATTGGHQLWLNDVSQGSDFTIDTSGDTIDRYFVGPYDYGNTTIKSGSDIDFDNVVITVGDTVNKNAYRSASVASWGVGGILLQDGEHIEPNITSVVSLVEGQYFHDGSDYVWVYPVGGGSPADYTIEQAARNNCVVTNNKNYLKFQDITMQASILSIMDTGAAGAATGLELDDCTLQYAYFYGLLVRGAVLGPASDSDDIVIHNCTFREIRSRHVYIDGNDVAGKNTLTSYGNTHTMDGEGYDCTNATESAQSYAYWLDNAHGTSIYNNTFNYLNFFDDGAVFDNTDMNMISMQGCDGVSIHDNSITGGRHGMQLSSCIGVDIYRNRISKTRDDFIWLYQDCTGTNNIYYNVCSDSGDDGFQIESVANVYNNIIARVSDTGINLFAAGDGANYKNNIIYQWGTNTDDGNDGYRATNNLFSINADYNCWYSNQANATQVWEIPGPTELSFAGWQAAGYDTHGINTDPFFTNPANGDLTLQSASPCINAGTNVGLTQDYAGNTVPKCSNSNPDIGAYEYQYDCPTTGGGSPPGYSNPPIPGPNGFRCIINNNDASTNKREVNLTLEAGSNVRYAAISEKQDFSDSGFEAFEPEVFTKKFMLSLGDGLKRVYAQFLTQYSRFSDIVYDDIVLDTSVPGQTTQEQQQQTNQQQQQTLTSNLLRAISDTKVYQIISNLKHWIPNPQTFNSYGFNWNNIQEVTESELDQYPRAKLLKPEGDIKVYYFTESGMIRHIPSPEVFNSYHNRWEDIITVSQTEINSYPINNLIRPENDIKVFKLENYIKRWVKTAETFNRLKYDWSKVAPVNQTELDYYVEGKVIE